MSTYPETVITEALEYHLAIMPGLATLLQSSTAAAPIAYENGPAFDPPKDSNGTAKPYLRLSRTPFPPDGIDIPGDYVRRGGSFQVSVFWPRGVGVTPASEVAGAIAEHFALNTIIERGTQRIRISRPSDPKRPIIEPHIMSIPVVITYDVLP